MTENLAYVILSNFHFGSPLRGPVADQGPKHLAIHEIETEKQVQLLSNQLQQYYYQS